MYGIFTFNNFSAARCALLIAVRHASLSKSQDNLTGDGGENSGVPRVFPSSSYLILGGDL